MMKKREWHRLLRTTLFCLYAFGSIAFAGDARLWTPDVATVNHIEELLRRMPVPTYGVVKADPFDLYGRYYVGQTNAGRKQIGADFYSMDTTKWPPGTHIGTPPYLETGGGCHHLMALYDVAEDRIQYFVCYGLG
jgi:hypothetical protein